MNGTDILHLTDASFDATLGDQPGLLLVDFWAEWCAPCRAIAPTLEALAREHAGRVRVAKVNVDEQPGLAARFGIHSIPTLLLFRQGKMIDQIVGALPKPELARRLDAASGHTGAHRA